MTPVRERVLQIVLDVAGAVAITIGCWWIDPAVGLIVGGALALGLSAVMDRHRR